MAHHIGAAERSTHVIAVANVTAQELDTGIKIAGPGACAVNLRVQIVQSPDAKAGAQKFPGEVRANKTSPTRDENSASHWCSSASGENVSLKLSFRAERVV
jgi:hypothetical protein